ncbi:alpha/beta hydrolase [Actinomadura decatromicini]|uniref:Alpha/beta hydrolase n=1 Tax=Actinomadura decatromicini TaxID=2604572 RepID=A0A5D3FNB1_9ACTN|nr:alpha/beta hydrolase [Actinomadura decatromicini]
MREVSVATLELGDGSVVWYRREGTGPTIVDIHGSGFGYRNFAMLTPHLVDSFDVIDLDLPGYGQSTANGPLGVAEWAGYVAEFIERLIGGPAYVHGTSMGAVVATRLAADHPEALKDLVLSCCLFRYDNAARHMRHTWKRGAMDSGMVQAADQTAAAGFSRSFYDRPDAADILDRLRTAMGSNDPESFVAGTESLEAMDLSDLLPRLPRTLLLGGDEDQMTPPVPAGSGVGFDTAVRVIPNAELHILEKCGHYLVLEQPERAAEVIKRFVSRSGDTG